MKYKKSGGVSLRGVYIYTYEYIHIDSYILFLLNACINTLVENTDPGTLIHFLLLHLPVVSDLGKVT